MSDLVERLRDDAESVEEIGCSSSQGRKVVSMTLRDAADEIERLHRELRCRFSEARAKAECSEALAPNSYGAGFDRGYSDALGELLEYVTEATAS